MSATLLFESDSSALVSGELSFTTVPDLVQKSACFFESTVKKLNFDFEKVERCDSAGITLLLHWFQLAQSKNIAICFLNLTEQMKSIIEICGLEDLFVISE